MITRKDMQRGVRIAYDDDQQRFAMTPAALTTAGYLVHDINGTIHGYGPTANEAWADMLITFQNAAIRLLDDDEEITESDGSWTRLSELKTVPATAAMLQRISDYGGTCTWGTRGGIACTPDEEA